MKGHISMKYLVRAAILVIVSYTVSKIAIKFL
jgi:hypothetical protein